MSPELSRAVFVVVVLLVLGWFAVGTQFNVRKGNRLLGRLQDGLMLLGKRTTLRWLGSSAVELKVQTALPPLRSAEVFIVLEPRDLPLLWWVFRARGRRDLLILRGELRSEPRFELEAVDARAWSTRGIERALKGSQWTFAAVPPPSTMIAYAHGRTEAVGELLALATVPGLTLVRLAVHRSAPNLELHWQVGAMDGIDARRVVGSLHRLAEQVC
jgi:hypothetical protein